MDWLIRLIQNLKLYFEPSETDTSKRNKNL